MFLVSHFFLLNVNGLHGQCRSHVMSLSFTITHGDWDHMPLTFWEVSELLEIFDIFDLESMSESVDFLERSLFVGELRFGVELLSKFLLFSRLVICLLLDVLCVVSCVSSVVSWFSVILESFLVAKRRPCYTSPLFLERCHGWSIVSRCDFLCTKLVSFDRAYSLGDERASSRDHA